jgi:hypothetical protein
MNDTIRFVVEVAVVAVAIVVWIRDWRRDAPRVHSWMIADGMRKIRDRVEAADAKPEPGAQRGYRDAVISPVVEDKSGFFERLRARRRAKQMLELERDAEG